MSTKIALVTGSARRIGAAIATSLHAAGYQVLLHYRHSEQDAEALAQSLNDIRAHSAHAYRADLIDINQLNQLASTVMQEVGQLDLLVNNASGFYPTPIGQINTAMWDDLINSNARTAFFLAQALFPLLQQSKGSIVNISDIHGIRPMKNYSVYCIAKAALSMVTLSLAKEFAPNVRVNSIAPGAIFWPENENALDLTTQQKILNKIPLEQPGTVSDIANTVKFLADSPYITGQILGVDGGRSLII